jgi:hypothetical protein
MPKAPRDTSEPNAAPLRATAASSAPTPPRALPSSSAPVRVQMGKLKEICAHWGVASKELDKLVEAGAVRPSAPASGKGSLRLLDERSLCDVFFAHSLKGLGVRLEHLVRVVQHLRAQYRTLLTERPPQLIIRFAPKRRESTRPAGFQQVGPKLVFDTRPLFRGLEVLHAVGRADTQIHRGRPKGNWRATFRGAVAQLSMEMQDKSISDEQIGAAIEAVRAARRKRAQEEIVVLPPP